MGTVVIISFVVCLLYLTAVSVAFGIPESISDSFYLLEGRRRGLGYAFTLWSWTVAFTVMSVMFVASEGQWYQFLGLFAGGGLGFVGAAPLFKGHERTVHYVSAGVCALAALAWMVCAGYGFIPALGLFIAFIASIWWRHPVFWVETALLLSMYATLLFQVES